MSHLFKFILSLSMTLMVMFLCVHCSQVASSVDKGNSEGNTEPEEPKKWIEFEKPEHVRGIYLTAWSAGSKRKMENILKMLEETDLNALVIDIRDAGNVYFKTGIELADNAKASHNAVRDPKALLQMLKDNNIYPIARISCFKDKFVPEFDKNLAVQKPDGKIWKDRSGSPWLDPYNLENWQYLSEVVLYALELGFPEIQLDYVRFPSEGDVKNMVFPAKSKYPKKDAPPQEVIRDFANYIRDLVHEHEAVISADLFGIISSGQDDQGIGQQLEEVAEPFDLICPMVYPSHYAKGEYGIKDPNSSPYAIVKASLTDFLKRLPGKPIRPWLQDFSLGVKYGKSEVQDQIKACYELGIYEFLLWNPRNIYTSDAVKNTKALMPKEKPKELPQENIEEKLKDEPINTSTSGI